MKRIIITGAPRSGSSALNNILNYSPSILSTEEMGIYNFNSRHYWNCKPHKLKLISNRKYLTQKNLTAYDLDNFFLGNFANKGDIEFFGDKFLAYSWDDLHVNHIVKNYPDAYFLFTYRNPCASIHSGFKRSQIDGNKKADWYFKSLEESTKKHIFHAANWATNVYPNVKNKIIINYDYYINNVDLLIKDLSKFLGIDMLISNPESLIGYNEFFDNGRRGLYIHPNPDQYKSVFTEESIAYINSQSYDICKRVSALIEEEVKAR